jgi:glycosyltransferase involved in cell wall biosynthesis
MNLIHLLASPFFGGPEKQMLGLACSLPTAYRSVFLSFAEQGRARSFLNQVRVHGFEAVELRHNTPHFRLAVQEVTSQLRRLRADLLCCHGYKADLLGLAAARRVGIPVIAVSHGWTGATLKVRFYEVLDKLSLRAMDAVVCVSEGQAAKVRRAGVPAQRVRVIRNAIGAERFARPDPASRKRLLALLPQPCQLVVGAAGRLSPEKGFGLLVEAAPAVLRQHPEAGFLLFGDGPLREAIARRIIELGLKDRVVLAGFRSDLDDLLPALDLMVLPSFTEGLPVVVLEALAAGVPVVATAVGGTPEVVEDGVNGCLVPPGNPAALVHRIGELLHEEQTRRTMGRRGRQRVQEEFTFAAQARQYQQLFEELGASISLKRSRRRLIGSRFCETINLPREPSALVIERVL